MSSGKRCFDGLGLFGKVNFFVEASKIASSSSPSSLNSIK
jgi:hypothetical protein